MAIQQVSISGRAWPHPGIAPGLGRQAGQHIGEPMGLVVDGVRDLHGLLREIGVGRGYNPGWLSSFWEKVHQLSGIAKSDLKLLKHHVQP